MQGFFSKAFFARLFVRSYLCDAIYAMYSMRLFVRGFGSKKKIARLFVRSFFGEAFCKVFCDFLCKYFCVTFFLTPWLATYHPCNCSRSVLFVRASLCEAFLARFLV